MLQNIQFKREHSFPLKIGEHSFPLLNDLTCLESFVTIRLMSKSESNEEELRILIPDGKARADLVGQREKAELS